MALFFAFFFSIASSSYSSSSGTCCKERELRVWILHLGKGKVVRHCGTPNLQDTEGSVSDPRLQGRIWPIPAVPS